MTTHTQSNGNDDALTMLFKHNLWANTELFAVCAKLSDDQLSATITGVYGSIFETLQHVARAERSYLHRIRTGQPFPRTDNPPPMKMAELQTLIRASGEGLAAVASSIKPDATVEIKWDDDSSRAMPVTILLTQAINHATEHRAQIMAMLTHIGIEPPELDGWTYFSAMSSH